MSDDAVSKELEQVRKQLRDAHRLILVLFKIGSKASHLARQAGFDPGIDENELADAIEMYENRKIEIIHPEKP